jgi:hypothetical protein
MSSWSLQTNNSKMPDPAEYIREAVVIMRRIANGELEDIWIPQSTGEYAPGEYARPAWEAYNAHWERHVKLPPYQQGILQEMWYTLESYDPRRDPDDPNDTLIGDVANWAGMRQKAAELMKMLESAPLDWERPSPFPDWFNSPPESSSTHVYDGGVLPSKHEPEPASDVK